MLYQSCNYHQSSVKFLFGSYLEGHISSNAVKNYQLAQNIKRS